MAATPSERVPLITLPNWVRAASDCGFDLEPLFREAGIDVDLVNVESATIERVHFERLMAACIARSSRRHFPFVLAETFAFEYLPEVETFLTTSPNLREALRVFDWLPSLINPLLTVRLVGEGPLSVLTLDWADANPPPAFQWFSESVFLVIVRFGRRLLRDRGDFRRITFQHLRPPYADQYATAFRLPVVFGQPHNALEIEARLLDAPLDGAFAILHRQAEMRVARRLSERPPPEGCATQLEHALERNPGLLKQGLEHAAGVLSLHPRTLQRRLKAEGLSFGDVQARLRLRLSKTWLADPALDMETISERLGFADRRSFTRAFSEWAGMTPSEYRTRKREGGV